MIEQFPRGEASAAIFPRYWPDQSAASNSSRDARPKVLLVRSSFSNHSHPQLGSIWMHVKSEPGDACFTFWFLQLHWWQIEPQPNLGSICSCAGRVDHARSSARDHLSENPGYHLPTWHCPGSSWEAWRCQRADNTMMSQKDYWALWEECQL